MTITALAPWFGGKRTLAPRIVEMLGPHRTYFEPFCGSMAVLLAKPHASFETVNDLHGDLINLARVIRDPVLGPKLYRRLRRVLFHERMAADATLMVAIREGQAAGDQPDISRAEAYFVSSWMGRNGSSGTPTYNTTFSRRFTSKGGSPTARYRGAVSSIAAWRHRLRDVTITSMDGFEMLERIGDEAGTAIYLDPPYVKKGARYLHDFESGDHARLAKLAKRFKHSLVLVSYYDHPAVREMYAGWMFVDAAMGKATANAGRRDKKSEAVAPEVLICNRYGALFSASAAHSAVKSGGSSA